MKLTKYIALFFLTITLAACAASKKSIDDSVEDTREYTEDTEAVFSNATLQSFRTHLSDAYTYRENKIPENFDRIWAEQQEKDLYEGYRIQIYSGQDVAKADTLAANFRVWADTTIEGYHPEAYVFFRTPYYRVHVGDFHERDRAIEFSNIVKRHYPDAWVVYDRVNPNSVPADTVNIIKH